SAGSYTVAQHAALGFAGAHELTECSQIAGGGSVVFRGYLSIAGHYDIDRTTGSTLMDGGTVIFSGCVEDVGRSLNVFGYVIGDTMDLNGADVDVDELSVNRHAVFLAGDITVHDQFVWNGGTIGGGGTVTVLEDGDTETDLLLDATGYA